MKDLRSNKFYLFCILALALTIRLAVLSVAWRADPVALQRDSASYIASATSLATEGSFEINNQPELFRTPGYPLFLAVCGLTGPLGYGIAQIAQVLLDVLLVYLTYLLGARLVSQSAGLWAAAFQACTVAAILSSVQILSDGLFSLLLTLAVLLILASIYHGHLRLLALGAAVTAVATYVRPVGIIFVPIVAVVLLSCRRRLVNLTIFIAVFAALVVPWYLRNYSATGFVGFSSVGDYNLLYYEAAGVSAMVRDLSPLQVRQELEIAHRKRLDAENIDIASSRALRIQKEMAFDILRAHPATLVRMHLTTSLATLLPASTGLLEIFGLTLGNRGTLSVLQSKGLRAAVAYYFGSNMTAMALMLPELAFLSIRNLACLAWVLSQLWLRKLAWRPAGLLIAATVFAFLFVSGPAATSRFRIPVEPFLNLAAGAGFVMFVNRRLARGKSGGTDQIAAWSPHGDGVSNH